jgi:hypothetical protein
MSTLKTGNITHPSSTGTAITLDASDNVNFNSNAVTGIASINGGQIGGNRNLIINGAMNVSQRGDYSSATTLTDDTYFLDRWVSDLATVSATIQNVSNGYLSKSKTQKLTATSSATGRIVSIQKIEVSSYMLGVELTASAQVKSNSSNARLFLVDNTNGTVLGVQAHTGGGAFEKLIVSGTPPTTCTDLRVYVALRSAAQANVAITSGDYFEFTEVQLELGSQATPFEHRLFGDELARCQRYYYALTNDGTTTNYMVGGVETSTAAGLGGLAFPTSMRAVPTATLLGTNVTKFYSGATGTDDSVSIGANRCSSTIGSLYITGFTGGTVGQACSLYNGGSGSGISFDAEL